MSGNAISGLDLSKLNVSPCNLFWRNENTSYIGDIIADLYERVQLPIFIYFIFYYSWAVLKGIIAIKKIEAFTPPKILLWMLVKFENFI